MVAEGTQAEGTPAEGTPAEGTPAEGTPDTAGNGNEGAEEEATGAGPVLATARGRKLQWVQRSSSALQSEKRGVAVMVMKLRGTPLSSSAVWPAKATELVIAVRKEGSWRCLGCSEGGKRASRHGGRKRRQLRSSSG